MRFSKEELVMANAENYYDLIASYFEQTPSTGCGGRAMSKEDRRNVLAAVIDDVVDQARTIVNDVKIGDEFTYNECPCKAVGPSGLSTGNVVVFGRDLDALYDGVPASALTRNTISGPVNTLRRVSKFTVGDWYLSAARDDTRYQYLGPAPSGIHQFLREIDGKYNVEVLNYPQDILGLPL